MKKILSIFCLVTFLTQVISQTPTVGDCLGAIPVCDPIYMETTSPSGDGNYSNEIAPGNCVQLEQNSVWYIFTVQNTGDFGFVLQPNDLSDDYDWSLFNLTGKSCEDIPSDPSMVVSCNAAGGVTCNGVTGADGSTPYNVQNFGCGQNPPVTNAFTALNAYIPVQAGNTYALLIINWTGSLNGYTLDFSENDEVGIFDIIQPEIESMSLPENCGDYQFVVDFSENISCESFDGAAVSIDGPGGPYTAQIISPSCENGGQFSPSFIIEIEPPINSSGDFTINIDDSPFDLCSNNLIADQFSFTIEKEAEGSFVTLDSVFCGEFSYTIDVSKEGETTYLWDDLSMNSTRTVAESGAYTVYIEAPCYTRTEIFNVLFQGFPIIESFSTDNDACELGIGSIYNIDVSGSSPFSYSIDDTTYTTTNRIDSLATNSYTLYVKDMYGCQSSEDFIIGEDSPTTSILTSTDYTIELNQSVNLFVEISGNYDSFWWSQDSATLSCLDCLDPTAKPDFTTTYTINAIDELGCLVSQDIVVRVIIPRDVYMPNIFSPNGDNINDRWTIASGRQLTNISELQIYTRWGELIFEAKDIEPGNFSQGWDGQFKGRTVNPGVYSFLVTLVYIDGEETVKTGTITVVN